MNLLIIRSYGPLATRGSMHAGALRLATLEETWKEDPDGPGGQRRQGALMESCVPEGVYQLEPHSGHVKDVWALVNHELGVYHQSADMPKDQKWGRVAILIHSGNDTDDIEGCIAVGLRYGEISGKPWVYDSKVALDSLRALLHTGGPHTLTIRAPLEGEII